MSNPPASPRSTRLTSRAAVLAVVICAIALSLAYPVREYMAQRQQIDQLVSQRQTMLTQVKNLEAQRARLSDRRNPAVLDRQVAQALGESLPFSQTTPCIARRKSAA